MGSAIMTDMMNSIQDSSSNNTIECVSKVMANFHDLLKVEKKTDNIEDQKIIENF